MENIKLDNYQEDNNNMEYKFRFNIDRGGTFTDIFCEYYKLVKTPPKSNNSTLITNISYPKQHLVYKLLSVDPHNYEDAPSEGIKRIIQQITHTKIQSKIPSDLIESIRMGTTLATNALLERKGERCALLITQGFKDLLEIGNQTRPNIFDLKIERPEKLYESVYEVNERVRIVNKNESTEGKCIYRQGVTGEYVEILNKLNDEEVLNYLKEIKSNGIKTIAVAFVHSYTFREHEQRVKELAEEQGFENISVSSEILPLVKFYPRGSTSVVDAYLNPAIHQYMAKFLNYFDDKKGLNVLFMQSDGGLTSHETFMGSKAIISGPAGGVVGYSLTTSRELKNKPIIGLDMGGTSTDVSRYDHGWEHVFEIQISGVAINSPQIDVNTVAAGGGSRLFYRNGMFVVGPESSGADPGPLCYNKNGFLSVTDANLVLGRLIPKHFPKIFGKDFNQPLSYESSLEGIKQITDIITKQTQTQMSIEEVAHSFIKVANEAMCRPIRSLTQARGYDPKDHVLSIFGGAGGQHACALAKLLGMPKVFIHKYAGILSAFGLSKAEIVEEVQEPVNKSLTTFCDDINAEHFLEHFFIQLEKTAQEKLKKMISRDLSLKFIRSLLLRYEGNDYNIVIQENKNYKLDNKISNSYSFAQNYIKDFEKAFKREYGFLLEKREIIIDYARVRASLTPIDLEEDNKDNKNADKNINKISENIQLETEANENDTIITYFEVNKQLKKLETKVYFWEKLISNTKINGPALIQSGNSTVVIEPDCIAHVTEYSNLIIDIIDSSIPLDQNLPSGLNTSPVITKDALELSLFANRFMSIAEQMGRHLQRTSVSTNIKERLDFSCALFDECGNLVANAPHLPVHLGAMQEVVKHQISYLKSNWHKGEVILCNHPQAGGSHLPDLTVISPVYNEDKLIFFVGNRGHHSDIGGLTPGSMPPFSKNLDEEGAAIYSFKLVEGGVFQEEKVRKIFHDDLIEKKVNPSRNLKDNISDLKAQVAANNKGIDLIMELVGKHGVNKIQAYMKFIQETAEMSVREMLDKFGEKEGIEKEGEGVTYAEDFMDDGSKICLKITINRKDKSAHFDFEGTTYQVYGNINTPRAVTYSAIIYCLRCLVNSDIPLNQGCLNPIKVTIPKDSLLWPSETCAVVGGNVTTSQRITDIVLKAFKACAASQGDMNNFTFGNERNGYYETIGGGSGAGPTWHGKSGVQVHMTNTRITDVEIIERRYPVLIKNFSFRKNSGGKGKFNGGNGIIRSFLFLDSLEVSILSERRVFSPFGLEGGQDGLKGINLYVRKDGIVFNVGSKNTVQVEKGDMFVIMTPGGGGYGKAGDQGDESKIDYSGKEFQNQSGSYFMGKGSLSKYNYEQYSN